MTYIYIKYIECFNDIIIDYFFDDINEFMSETLKIFEKVNNDKIFGEYLNLFGITDYCVIGTYDFTNHEMIILNIVGDDKSEWIEKENSKIDVRIVCV